MGALPNQIYLVIGAVLLLGLVLAWMGFRRLFSRRVASGGVSLIAGLAALALVVASLGIIANLYTYQRLTAEQPVGTLAFERYAPQEFVATLVRRDGTEKAFSVFGDECQLDARILKWRGSGNLLGLDTLYRLERLAGRYSDSVEETENRRSVFPLAEEAGIELWELVNRFEQWLPWVDAVYGNAVYVPMAPGARYRVSITTSGLIARPDNTAAERAVSKWR